MKSAWNRWRAWARKQAAARPFVRLAGHFVNRSLRGGAESDSEELDFSTGLLLMLLPVPGIFVSIIFYDKYSTFLQWIRKDLTMEPYRASLGDEYLFIVVSMVLTGVIAVWRWDSILLDRRDFANLVHLPVSPMARETRVASKSSHKSSSHKKTPTASGHAPTQTASAGTVHHKVKPGETLYSIATSYNTTVSALKKDNRNVAVLRPGMILVVHDVH